MQRDWNNLSVFLKLVVDIVLWQIIDGEMSHKDPADLIFKLFSIRCVRIHRPVVHHFLLCHLDSSCFDSLSQIVIEKVIWIVSSSSDGWRCICVFFFWTISSWLNDWIRRVFILDDHGMIWSMIMLVARWRGLVFTVRPLRWVFRPWFSLSILDSCYAVLWALRFLKIMRYNSCYNIRKKIRTRRSLSSLCDEEDFLESLSGLRLDFLSRDLERERVRRRLEELLSFDLDLLRDLSRLRERLRDLYYRLLIKITWIKKKCTKSKSNLPLTAFHL